MTGEKTPLDIPKNPAQRRAWILFRLKCAGLSFRSLAQNLGVSPQSVQKVASGIPTLTIELAIAEAIEVDPTTLFAEHYRRGRRLPKVRALRQSEHSGRDRPAHVESDRRA